MLTFAFTETNHLISIEDVRLARVATGCDPFVKCPACDSRLSAHLRKRKLSSFVHRPQPLPCYASSGEGELHLSAKAYLQSVLASAAAASQPVWLRHPCKHCSAGQVDAVAFQLQPGDDVRVEEWVAPSRKTKPDVLVYREGRLVAVLEVLVTHACDEAKLAELRKLAVPMLEVKAEELLDGEGQLSWTPSLPLPFTQLLSVTVPERCGACEKRFAEEERRRLEPLDQVPYHAHVHFFRKDGVREDHLLQVVESRRNGAWVSARLEDRRGARVLTEWGPDVAGDLKRLDEAMRAAANAFVDSRRAQCDYVHVYGGFRRESSSQAPRPAYLWDVGAKRWIRARPRYGLADALRLRGDTVERWVRSGFLEVRRVKADMSSAEPPFNAVTEESIQKALQWLQEKRKPKQLPPVSSELLASVLGRR